MIFDFKNRGFDPFPVIVGIEVDRDGNLFVGLHASQQFWVIDPRYKLCQRYSYAI